MKIRDYATARVKYGYRRIHVLLQREGLKINRKRVYRHYCLENLRKFVTCSTLESIRVDNGPEFVLKELDLWAYHCGVKLSFSRPGKPTDSPHIESFNGSFREECLQTHWFLSLEDAKIKIETRRRDYNEFRPDSSLGYRTPKEFASLESGSNSLSG